MIVDLFAGYGGASLGIRDALGRDPDVAINHSPVAVAVHAANHPETRHLEGDVWHYAPRDVTRGAPVELLWASPTCTFFSKAKGAPLDRREASRVRALAWCVGRWAREVHPTCIVVENVEAFQKWGPLLQDGRPCPRRSGATFRKWVRTLQREGYEVQWRELRASDYGAPTSRNRLFIIARCDGNPISWPEPTHGPGRPEPHRGAHEVLDWSIPAPSIFGRAKPLVEATLRRVARGIRRFVLDTPEPWIIKYNGTGTGSLSSEPLHTVTTRDRFAVATPYLIPTSHGGDARVHSVDDPLRTVTASSRSPFQLLVPSLIHVSNGERPGQAPRVYNIQAPLGTVVAGGVKHALVTAHLAKHFGGHEGPGQSVRTPLGTVTTRDHHALVVCSTIGDKREQVRDLMRRCGPAPEGLFARRSDDISIEVGDATYELADVGMRLLVPRELARSHDFDDGLALEVDVHGRPVTRTNQVRLVGNSVSRRQAAAVLRANIPRSPVERRAA